MDLLNDPWIQSELRKAARRSRWKAAIAENLFDFLMGTTIVVFSTGLLVFAAASSMPH